MKFIRKVLLFIISVVLIAILSIGMIFILSVLQQIFLVPKDYLIWTVNPPTYTIVLILIGVFDYYLLSLIGRYTKVFCNTIPNSILLYLRTHKMMMILVLMTCVYVLYPNVTSFTDDTIHHRSFYNLTGTEYLYSDVVNVEAGIYGGSEGLRKDKGEFYYVITLKDGTSIDLNNIGRERGDDSFSMIEYIDQKLMYLGVEKNSSLKNIELSSLGQHYIDRLIRILNN